MEEFLDGIVWAQCADIELRDDDYATYGLDTPTCTLELYYKETVNTSTGEFNEDGSAIMEPVEYDLTYSFMFGSLTGSYYYATSSETNRCYLVDQSVVKTLLALEEYLFEDTPETEE